MFVEESFALARLSFLEGCVGAGEKLIAEAKEIGSISGTARLRCIANWLCGSLVLLQHPPAPNIIYGAGVEACLNKRRTHSAIPF
jgi:hypothetical protein